MSNSPAFRVEESRPAPGAREDVPSSLASAPTPFALAPGMRRVSLWLILILVGSFIFLDYWAYSMDIHQHVDKYELFLHGQGTAPAQYRVGPIFAAKFLHSYAHLTYARSLAFFDLIFAFAAVYLLRAVLVASPAFQRATPASRWLRVAVLLALVSFYFSWSLWYQRPDTMASAFFLACNLYLLSITRSPLRLITGMLILAIAQSSVRADIAILFYGAIFVYVLFRGARGFLLKRPALLLTSFAFCALPTAILWLLMHKIFPHATYGDTKLIQILYNLSPLELFPFLLFMSPTFFTVRRVIARHCSIEGPQAALILGAAFFLGSWILVGRIEEVRIFVPFAMALIPLGANLAGDLADEQVVPTA